MMVLNLFIVSDKKWFGFLILSDIGSKLFNTEAKALSNNDKIVSIFKISAKVSLFSTVIVA